MSWGDFLGYGVGNPPGTLVQFEEARELVREQTACAPLDDIS